MAEKTFDAAVDQLDEVLAFVTDQLDQLDCPPKHRIQIEVAVEELFVNIANYAYVPREGSATIRMESQPEAGTVAITFIDRGIPYNPVAKPDPDVTLSAAERKIGGLGIYMVKKSMDTMTYERLDGQNVLTITKTVK